MPLRSARWIFTCAGDSTKSMITCRQIPQGGHGGVASVTTTTSSIRVDPSLTALTTAVRSAQTVAPYEEFSTLQPPYMRPSEVRIAAPMRHRLYGAWERSRERLASSKSSFRVEPGISGLPREFGDRAREQAGHLVGAVPRVLDHLGVREAAGRDAG